MTEYPWGSKHAGVEPKPAAALIYVPVPLHSLQKQRLRAGSPEPGDLNPHPAFYYLCDLGPLSFLYPI